MAEPTDQITVLEAVRARLISQIPSFFNESTLVISDEEEPPETWSGEIIATITPTDGGFDQEAFAGGGEHTVFEEAGVAITVFRRSWLDRAKQSEEMLLDPSKGLLYLKKLILKALSGQQLYDANGNALLINLMSPITASKPRRGDWKRAPLGDLQLTFSTDFHWDLT